MVEGVRPYRFSATRFKAIPSLPPSPPATFFRVSTMTLIVNALPKFGFSRLQSGLEAPKPSVFAPIFIQFSGTSLV